MSKTRKICPVCGNEHTGNKTYCSVCSWSFPEDCTQNGVLFTEEQLKQYEERVAILQKLVKDGGTGGKARIQELEESIRRLQTSESEWKKKYEDVKQRTAQLEQENQKNRKELVEAKKTELANRDLKVSKERLEQSNRELKTTNSRLEESNRDLRATNSRLEDSNRDLRVANSRLEEENRQLRAKAAAARTQVTPVSPKKLDPIPVQVPKRTVEPKSAPKSIFDDVNTRPGLNGQLSNYSIDEICRRIADGSFEGLYVGDHFYINGKEYLFAGFDCLPDGYKGADGKFRNHYAVIIPGECMDVARMYTSRLDNKYHNVPGDAGYKNSHLYKNVLPKLADRLQKDFNHHILHKNDQKELELMSRNMVDGRENVNGQLPIFKMWPHTKSVTSRLFGAKGIWYWLRDQVDGGRFAACNPEGIVSDLAETADTVGVRPYFCIG